MGKMQAIVTKKANPFFEERWVDAPTELGPRDLCIAVQAISVNPIDLKMQESLAADATRILGWDATGIVQAVGSDCAYFQVGEAVMYAGSLVRSGCQAQYHVVDERLVGKKPEILTFAESAAIPLTALTAWEALHERLALQPTTEQTSILIINGAGGVGSMAVQLAKQLGLTVIATASRQETHDWVKQMGADIVLNHHQPLKEALQQHGKNTVDYILCLHDTNAYWQQMCDLIVPQGKICAVVTTQQSVDLAPLKEKSASFAWEFVFTRATFQTADQNKQHFILNQIANAYQAQQLKKTCTQTLYPITAKNLTQAYQQLRSGKMIGKLTLARWL